jgi:hypothetical protein
MKYSLAQEHNISPISDYMQGQGTTCCSQEKGAIQNLNPQCRRSEIDIDFMELQA